MRARIACQHVRCFPAQKGSPGDSPAGELHEPLAASGQRYAVVGAVEVLCWRRSTPRSPHTRVQQETAEGRVGGLSATGRACACTSMRGRHRRRKSRSRLGRAAPLPLPTLWHRNEGLLGIMMTSTSSRGAHVHALCPCTRARAHACTRMQACMHAHACIHACALTMTL